MGYSFDRVVNRATDRVQSLRPAETTAVSATAGLLVARYFGGIDSEQALTAVAVIIGAIPLVVTKAVDIGRDFGLLPRPPEPLPLLGGLSEEIDATARSALRKSRDGGEWSSEIHALVAVASALERFRGMHVAEDGASVESSPAVESAG